MDGARTDFSLLVRGWRAEARASTRLRKGGLEKNTINHKDFSGSLESSVF